MIAIPAVDAVGVAQSPETQYGHNQVSVKNSHLAHEQELMAPSLVSMDKSSFRVSSIPPKLADHVKTNNEYTKTTCGVMTTSANFSMALVD